MAKFNSGFTLLELLVAVGIVAIVLAAAAPPLSQFVQNRKMDSQTSLIASALSSARSLALSKAVGTSVCWNDTAATVTLPSPDETINVEPGQILVIDSSEANSNDRVKSQVDFLSVDYNFINDFTAAAANQAQCVDFDSQGRSATPGNFVLCRDDGDEADAITIVLNINGRSSEAKGNQIADTDCV